MLLVLCNETDSGALWAAQALARRGLAPMVLTDADLAAVDMWRHRVGAAPPDCELRLSDGRRLRARDMSGVLNRLSGVPWMWERRVGGPDRGYALQEMYAFYLNWLNALPGPVLNPPTPQGLCGNWRHPSLWAAMAARAGLPTQPFRQSSDDDPASVWTSAVSGAVATLHVIGARVIGPGELARSYGDACRRLARCAGAPLLGLSFLPDVAGRWRMARASIMPDLASGGEPLADALAEELTS